MVIELDQLNGICIVRVKGRLGAGAELEYLSTKAGEIKSLGCTKLLLDLSEVESIGSTGIGFLFDLYASIMRVPGRSFILVGANRHVRAVLDVTRVTTVIPMAEDMESGLTVLRESLQKGRPA
jgi:anti-anti-sigma factor